MIWCVTGFEPIRVPGGAHWPGYSASGYSVVCVLLQNFGFRPEDIDGTLRCNCVLQRRRERLIIVRQGTSRRAEDIAG
jgi:hypothetical protein